MNRSLALLIVFVLVTIGLNTNKTEAFTREQVAIALLVGFKLFVNVGCNVKYDNDIAIQQCNHKFLSFQETQAWAFIICAFYVGFAGRNA